MAATTPASEIKSVQNVQEDQRPSVMLALQDCISVLTVSHITQPSLLVRLLIYFKDHFSWFILCYFAYENLGCVWSREYLKLIIHPSKREALGKDRLTGCLGTFLIMMMTSVSYFPTLSPVLIRLCMIRISKPEKKKSLCVCFSLFQCVIQDLCEAENAFKNVKE